MGKSKKVRLQRAGPMPHKQKTDLAGDIIADENIKDTSRRQEKVRLRQEEDQYVDQKLTKKIIKEALKQQKELEKDVGTAISSKDGNMSNTPKLIKSSDSDSEDDNWPDLNEGAMQDAQFVDEEIVIDEEDEEALKLFMNPNPKSRKTLADMIMDKITEKKTEVSTMLPDTEDFIQDLHPSIVEAYKDVKTILKKYRSGKLPKAFKVIPHLKNWEEILYITEPDTWSAAAVYQATRIFASNSNVAMAQRFYNLILMPRIRDDIEYYKRLNFHLFMALKKALYRPAAFFKGIVLPLCDEGTCTLREATIISSVLIKCSLPVLHASAALLKIAEMSYSGANSVFLRALIMKKYALPFRVIDGLVFHFVQFRHDKRQMPVLWHQALLAFIEIYRNDVSDEQAENLQELLKYQIHPKITPEIRQQLMTRESREIVMYEPDFDH